jgi:hypothetical protein
MMILFLVTVLFHLRLVSAFENIAENALLPIIVHDVINSTTLPEAEVAFGLQTVSPDFDQKITFNSISIQEAGGIPPDPSGAAGPSSVISVVNFAIQAMT